MASNTSNNGKTNPDLPSESNNNPFVKFRHHVDQQIGFVLKGMQSIIGLPSSFSKSNGDGNTHWTEWDDYLRRRDALQQRQKELEESVAARAKHQGEIEAHDRIPRDQSSDSYLLLGGDWEEDFFGLPMLFSFGPGSRASFPHRRLRQDYILPYVLFSPYSPLALKFKPPISSTGFRALSPNEEFPYRAAFEDLLLASGGQEMRPLESLSSPRALPFGQGFRWGTEDNGLSMANAVNDAERQDHGNGPDSNRSKQAETELDLFDHIAKHITQESSSIFKEMEAAMEDADSAVTRFLEGLERSDDSKQPDETKTTATQTESPKQQHLASYTGVAADGIARFVFEHVQKSDEQRGRLAQETATGPDAGDEIPWYQKAPENEEAETRQLPHSEGITSTTTRTTTVFHNGTASSRVVVNRTFADGSTETTETVTPIGHAPGRDVEETTLDDYYHASVTPRSPLSHEDRREQIQVNGEKKAPQDQKPPTGSGKGKGWFWE